MRPRGCAAIFVSGLLAVACASVPQQPRLDSHLRAVIIKDPEFGGIKAFTVNIPSTWHFQGTVTAGVGCNFPSPVFRAYSPDGLTEIRLLPWFWFNWRVRANGTTRPERLNRSRLCIALNGPMTATQFLARYLRKADSPRILGPMSISKGYRRQLDQLVSRMNAVPSKETQVRSRTTADAAAVRIEITNGTFTIRERLRARVLCTYWTNTISGQLGYCTARLDVLRAPKGGLDALVNLVDGHNLTTARNDDRWLHQVMVKISGAQRKAFQDPYIPNRAAAAVLYRQALDFGLINPINVWPRFTSRRPTVVLRTRDWADFALDFMSTTDADGHVVRDPLTVSTWRNADGQWYQTGHADANPNGVFPGRWTVDIAPLIDRDTPPQ